MRVPRHLSLRPRTLRGTVVLTVVVSTVLICLATAAVLVVGARSTIYESRQNAILRDFETRSTRLFDEISTEAPDETWDYLATTLPGQALIVDLDSPRAAGALDRADVPESITATWREEAGRQRYLRTEIDGQQVFLVGTARTELDSDPGGAVGLVVAYSLAPEEAQVRSLLTIGALTAAGGLLVAVALALWVGTTLTRPVRRLAEAARELGDGATPEPFRSGYSDIDAVAHALTDSAGRLAESMAELERREGHARRLVSDVAHELRTPLTSMTAVSEILEDLDGATPDERRTAVDITRRGTERLTALVAELLEMSRLDAGVATVRVSAAPVLPLVTEVVALVAPGGDVTVVGDPGLVVSTDHERLRTVVSNLVSNAVRHGSPPVVVTVERTGGTVQVTVRDHGPGIPERDLDRVFDRFTMLDPSRQELSTGLGLAIARENARLLGGDLVALPTAGGATVRLTVPGGSTAPE